MPWFKVDDKLHDHRKSRRAKKDAMGVWVLAGSWSADHLTDGFIPSDVLPRWGTEADAATLVDADLWVPHEKAGEVGWLFLNWEEYQPTKAEIEAERQKKADAGRKGGIASGRSRREARGSAGASSFVEAPTRPDPSRPAAAAAESPAIAILRAKMQAQSAFQALRFDTLRPEQVTRIERCIEVHGDERLVQLALDTRREGRPAILVSAFIGTWEAAPPPGTRLAVVKAYCDTHGVELTPGGVCRSCSADAKVGDA